MLLIDVPIQQPDPLRRFFPLRNLPVSIRVTQCSLFERQDHKEFVNLALIPKRHGSTPLPPPPTYRNTLSTTIEYSFPRILVCRNQLVFLSTQLNPSRKDAEDDVPPPLLVVNPKTAVGSRDRRGYGQSMRLQEGVRGILGSLLWG